MPGLLHSAGPWATGFITALLPSRVEFMVTPSNGKAVMLVSTSTWPTPAEVAKLAVPRGRRTDARARVGRGSMTPGGTKPSLQVSPRMLQNYMQNRKMLLYLITCLRIRSVAAGRAAHLDTLCAVTRSAWVTVKGSLHKILADCIVGPKAKFSFLHSPIPSPLLPRMQFP